MTQNWVGVNRRWYGVLSIFLCAALNARGNGILTNGMGGGARTMAMGGADVAWAADPLSSMAINPAGLGSLTRPEFYVGAAGGFATGTFNKPGVSHGNLDSSPAALPEGAFAMPIGKSPVVIGISCVPESAQLANWHFQDPPGGLGGATSYGYQQYQSEILALRSSFGIGVQINPQWSVGASVGATYQQNRLTQPYNFQNLTPGGPGQPANSGLDGAKTTLTLDTQGFGWNALIGVIYKSTPDLQFGVSYESETQVTATGAVTGDPSLQFGFPQGTLPFHYDASVKTVLPQQVRFGGSWKFLPQWRLAGQIDWIDWKDAFNKLPMSFSNGNNPTVDSVLGSSFNDTAPLNWKSEFVYRSGIEFEPTENWALRVGYSYGGNPVPTSTMTPTNAAIFENTFTCGVGYHWKDYTIDFAYQYDLPTTQNIGTSNLLTGEYSNSSIKVSAQTFALTAGVRF